MRLTWELERLEHAADAARMICEASHLGQFATDRDAKSAPRAACAVLLLIEQRLRLLQSALRGDVKLEVAAAHYNVMESESKPEDSQDVVPLPPSEALMARAPARRSGARNHDARKG